MSSADDFSDEEPTIRISREEMNRLALSLDVDCVFDEITRDDDFSGEEITRPIPRETMSELIYAHCIKGDQ